MKTAAVAAAALHCPTAAWSAPEQQVDDNAAARVLFRAVDLERVTTFKLGDVLNEREKGGDPYFEFFHRRSLEVGVYVLARDASDEGEKVHPFEDDVYFVVSGQAKLHADGQDYRVKTGDVVFVAADTEHWYHSISEKLTLLVFFAPNPPS